MLREIKSLARGLTILDLLAGQESMGVTDMAQALELDKSTTSRLVQTLVHRGYVERVGPRRYRLTTKLATLGQRRIPLEDRARPLLYQLVEQTGECAHVAVYTDGMAHVVEDVETTSLLRVSGGSGRMTPLHCTALGKCLLAFADIPLPDVLPRKTKNTLIDADRLKAHLNRIRQQGYAMDDEELEIGVRCLAAPVFDDSGKAIAAIGISGPVVRVTLDREPVLALLLMNSASILSRELGYVRNTAS